MTNPHDDKSPETCSCGPTPTTHTMTSQDFVQGSSKPSQESNNSSPQSSQDSKGKSKARSPSQDLFDDLEDEDFSELFSQISPTASKDEVDEPLYVSPPKRESSLDESASVPVKDNKRGREESDDDERCVNSPFINCSM